MGDFPRIMNYPWLDEHCLSKKGSEKDFKQEWEAYRYMVGGKMFAMLGGDKYAKPIITLKLEPRYGEFLRNQYSDIIPGYYMNKEHWNSLYLDGSVPDAVLKDMIDKSYGIIFDSLTKKARVEIDALL